MKTEIARPEIVCPNCWGQQEYDGKILDAIKDRQIDLNNKVEKEAFIMKFVSKNLKSAILKKRDAAYECPTCKTRFPLNLNKH
jgi:DNA-directed RNA polymerase subunit RPC12/RpoP